MPRSEEAWQRIREEQRTHILEAAKRVFARKGPAATMDDIAAESSVSHGLAYRYFANKEAIFSALGISVADFQVAGGLILLGLAVRDLMGFNEDPRTGSADFGVVPLGMPLIAGPALLTALLLLMDSVGALYTILSLLVNLLLVEIGFRYAQRIEGLLGKQGLKGVSKLIALLLAAIAVSLIRRGWQAP